MDIHACVFEFKRQLQATFGVRLRDFRLFGSRARGEAHEDSDVDLLVVVEGLTSAEAREINYLSGDYLTEHDVLLRPLALSSEQWQHLVKRERRLAQEIQKDGVSL
jgi:predicted nucleotidyltransferase